MYVCASEFSELSVSGSRMSKLNSHKWLDLVLGSSQARVNKNVCPVPNKLKANQTAISFVKTYLVHIADHHS